MATIKLPPAPEMPQELDNLLFQFSFLSGLKAGKRNSDADQKRIQTVHDMTVEMGVPSHMMPTEPTKANSRFSRDDMALVQTIHDHAVNLGGVCAINESQYPEGKTAVTDPTKIAKREDVSPKRGKKEYGNVSFADEKNKKYPIDTEAHIRAAWNYINKEKNASKYSSEDVATIKRKIVSAWKEKIDKDGPPSASTKNNSLQDTVNDVRDNWYQWWHEDDAVIMEYPENADEENEYGYSPCPPILDVLDDAIIIKLKTKEYRVGYTEVAEDEYEFDSPDKWTQVEYTWEEVKAGKQDLLINYGDGLKIGEDGHLRGYLVRFSTAEQPDTTGDFFTKDTEFQLKSNVKYPVFFHHCLPLKSKAGNIIQVKEQIGDATIEEDDEGLLIDAILFNNTKYRSAIMKSVKSLGWSSGTAAHLILKEKNGNAWKIKRWPLVEGSITPTPAEIRNEVYSVKSISTPEIDWEEPEAETKSAASAVPTEKPVSIEGNQKNNSLSSGDLEMTKEEVASLVQDAVKGVLDSQKAEADKKAAEVKAIEDAKKAEQERINAAVAEALKSMGIRTQRRAVNAGGVKTDPKGNGNSPAILEKTERGDDAFKAFNYWIKTGDREALRDTERMNSEDADMLNPENFTDSIKSALGTKTTYNVLEITQYQGQELVPTEVYNRIIELRDPVSIARVGGAQVIPIGARTTNFPVEKNRSGKFVIANEGSAYDANAAQPFDKKAITAFKFTRTIGMGIEVMEDSVADLTGWWTRHVARMEALTENYYFTVGAAGGASEPEGITTGGTLGVTTATGAALLASEVVKLFYKLPQPYRDNPTFVCNGTTEGVIRALSGNWFQFQPTPSGSGGGNYPMGADWIISPKCKLLVAADMADIGINAISAVVGNWAEYVIAERSAMSIFRDPYSSAGSGLVNFHCHFRRGGMVGQAEAFQYLKGNSA